MRAVLTAFVDLYKKGLIYRGKRMVNWCTVCGTALADDEVEHGSHAGHLWHLRYPILDAAAQPTGAHLVVATTRPETMLGDTAVAVHPDDERYRALVGKQVLLPLQNRPIPVIADPFVDRAFGTGVVKLTPAHDPNDYAASLRHNLALEVVIGDDGKMTAAAGSTFAGLDRYEARTRVVAELERLELLEKVEPHTHAPGECYRCKSVLEPKVSDQWFVKMRPLAEKAKQVVLDGRLKIVPESEKHDYFHWMDTIQDWCISRQLWWGHRIPVYYCDDCGHNTVTIDPPAACEACGSAALRQDEDVLDTWFSAQLWPFSTLGWPAQTEELKFWYPNTWLMSGRDILFFWDARMIMSGLELLADVPFRTLVLHGLVRDAQGRKLSKSLGNSPDPLDLFDKYGTDAVRVAIALNYPMGRQDTRLSEELFRNGQGLVIKLWNAAKLFLGHLESGAGLRFSSQALLAGSYTEGGQGLAQEDRWILSRLSATVRAHDENLEKNEVVHAVAAVNSFFWNDYCDWYLEIIKPRLWGGGAAKRTALEVAALCQRTLLQLFHPYMPFVTEELWQVLRRAGVEDSEVQGDERSVAGSRWPQHEPGVRDLEVEAQMEQMISLVRAVRDVRQNLNISAKLPLKLQLAFHNQSLRAHFEPVRAVAMAMGAVERFSEYTGQGVPSAHVPLTFSGGLGYVELPSEVDAGAISSKLLGRIEKLEKQLEGVQRNLNNPEFVANAPQALVEESNAKARELKESIQKLAEFRRLLG